MFDYLGILISVILGLALTHLLMGCSRLIQTRDSVRIYWVHVLWVVNVLVYVLAVWWGMFWWRKLAVWTIQDFLFLSAYASVLFMLASILFPAEYGAGMDFEAYFFRNRQWFFGLQLLAFALDIPETAAKGVSGLRDVPLEYWVFLPSIVALNIWGLVSNGRRAHAIIAPAWAVVLISYLTLTSLDRIVAS